MAMPADSRATDQGPGESRGQTAEELRPRIDVRACRSPYSLGNKAARALWGLVWLLLFRPSPMVAYGWRRLLLRAFGARIGRAAKVMPSVRVWAPWNLEMGEYSCLSHYVDCYSADKVSIGAHATVSQYSFLCTATHDVSNPHMGVVTAPISIEDQAWVCADVFVGPGVSIGTGAVVGARSSVFRDLPPWKVCVGTPARPTRDRILKRSRS